MSTQTTPPDVSPAAPKKRRNAWIWVSGGLAVVVVGLVVWGLHARSDLDSTQQQLADTNQQLTDTNKQLDSTKQQLDTAKQSAEPAPTPDEKNGGKTVALVAAGALFTKLAKDLGATREDLAATEQDLENAQKAADTAEQDAATAKKDADNATDEAAKAKAQADQADAEVRAAQSKAKIAADCAKSYISAFAGLLESEDVEAELPDLRKQLSAITADCKAAFAGA